MWTSGARPAAVHPAPLPPPECAAPPLSPEFPPSTLTCSLWRDLMKLVISAAVRGGSSCIILVRPSCRSTQHSMDRAQQSVSCYQTKTRHNSIQTAGAPVLNTSTASCTRITCLPQVLTRMRNPTPLTCSSATLLSISRRVFHSTRGCRPASLHTQVQGQGRRGGGEMSRQRTNKRQAQPLHSNKRCRSASLHIHNPPPL